MTVIITNLPMLTSLTGSEQVLVLRDGQATLVSAGDIAQAPQMLIGSASGSLLDRAREMKRNALHATAARLKRQTSTYQASTMANMPGAILDSSIAESFDASMADIDVRLTERLAAIDNATTISQVDAILW